MDDPRWQSNPYFSVCAVIPTRNESETIGEIVTALHYAGVQTVYVMDDSDDQKTKTVAEYVGAVVPRRRTPARFGPALIDGLRYGVGTLRFSHVLVMDAGLSHDPAFIHRLLNAAATLQAPDVVIGSRFSIADSPWLGLRTVVSKAASRAFSLAVGRRVKDATAGFRVYRTDALCRVLQFCQADWFGVQMELLGSIMLTGVCAAPIEIPVPYRLTGSTFGWKMIPDALRVLKRLTVLRWLRYVIRRRAK